MHFDEIPLWLIVVVIVLGAIILAGKMQEAGINLPDYGPAQRILLK